MLFRDVEFIVAALLVPWFFLTPILYPLTDVPGRGASDRARGSIHWVNPLTPAIQAIRAPLFLGTLPFWGDALYLVVAARARARARRVRLQPRRRPDRDRSLTTSRPSNIDGSSPSGG